VTGWAIDQGACANTGVDQVHVYIYPTDAGGNVTGSQVFSTPASYGGNRPDIAGAFGAQFVGSGFSAQVNGLTLGNYAVVIYASAF